MSEDDDSEQSEYEQAQYDEEQLLYEDQEEGEVEKLEQMIA